MVDKKKQAAKAPAPQMSDSLKLSYQVVQGATEKLKRLQEEQEAAKKVRWGYVKFEYEDIPKLANHTWLCTECMRTYPSFAEAARHFSTRRTKKYLCDGLKEDHLADGDPASSATQMLDRIGCPILFDITKLRVRRPWYTYVLAAKSGEAFLPSQLKLTIERDRE
ncbi:hypothetical protein CBOM_04203 [Ceraceosorus bombacis]|uniref:Uncharacterized protein n=1 Tax=Ceraceosorus bombacis TaxID=401625 RepID=A0A0P1BPC7_9BASI|nr:hypothetical protein CBOM_04203 [Ceraceosorus bombacis]